MLLFAFIFFICLWVDVNSTNLNLTTKDVLAKWEFEKKDLLTENIASTEFELSQSISFTIAIKEAYKLRTSCKFYASRISNNIGHPNDTCVLASCKALDCRKFLKSFMTWECLNSTVQMLKHHFEKKYFHVQCALDNKALPMYSAEVTMLITKAWRPIEDHGNPHQSRNDESSLETQINRALNRVKIVSHNEAIKKYNLDLSEKIKTNMRKFISTPLSTAVEEVVNKTKTDQAKSPKRFKLSNSRLKNGFTFLGQSSTFINANGAQKLSIKFSEITITDNTVPEKFPFSCDANEPCLVVNEVYYLPLETGRYNSALPYVFYAENLWNSLHLNFRFHGTPIAALGEFRCTVSATYQNKKKLVTFDLAYCHNHSCLSPLKVLFGKKRISGLETWNDIYAVPKFDMHITCSKVTYDSFYVFNLTLPFKISHIPSFRTKLASSLLPEQELDSEFYNRRGQELVKNQPSYYVATERNQTVGHNSFMFGISDDTYYSPDDEPRSHVYQIIPVQDHKIYLLLTYAKLKIQGNELILHQSGFNPVPQEITVYLNDPAEKLEIKPIPFFKNDISSCEVKFKAISVSINGSCDNGCSDPITIQLPLAQQEILKTRSGTLALQLEVICAPKYSRKHFSQVNITISFELSDGSKPKKYTTMNPQFVYVKNLHRMNYYRKSESPTPELRSEVDGPLLPPYIPAETNNDRLTILREFTSSLKPVDTTSIRNKPSNAKTVDPTLPTTSGATGADSSTGSKANGGLKVVISLFICLLMFQ